MSENARGTLEVGTNPMHEVVINLPRDMTGHIVFSPQQARALADTLLRKATAAENLHRAELEAKRRAEAPPVDRSNLCTTDGRSPEEARASQTNETGQHPSYIVLCDAERAKGFVRPYRDAYKHVGLNICGLHIEGDTGGTVCYMDLEHDGPCGIATGPRPQGCGGVTTMGRALSETYARDPTFYGATFCCNCNAHFPIAQFVWTADGARVGS